MFFSTLCLKRGFCLFIYVWVTSSLFFSILMTKSSKSFGVLTILLTHTCSFFQALPQQGLPSEGCYIDNVFSLHMPNRSSPGLIQQPLQTWSLWLKWSEWMNRIG